jgi:protein-tyrosine phosphatase
LTFAPGKHDRGIYSGDRWERDLDADLTALRNVYEAQTLVCLLENQELIDLGIPDYVARVAAHDLELKRFPIRDACIPENEGALRSLVGRLAAGVRAGRRLVVHCRGGLGRAGTVAGCVLVALGVPPDEALVRLRVRDPSKCPETKEQRDFVRLFRV